MNSTNICIIGGGIIGLCSAYYLQKTGYKVTVVDKSAMNSGASFVNAGIVTPSHIIPLAAPGMPMQGIRHMFNSTSPFYLKPKLDKKLMEWSWQFLKHSTQKHVDRSAPVLKQFNEKSRALYLEIAALENLEFSCRETGLLMLCNTEEKLRHEKKAGEYARKQGLEVRFLDRAEVESFEPEIPPNVVGAVYYPADMLLIPQNFMSKMHDLLIKKGVTILPENNLKGIEFQDQKPTALQTEKGKILFDKLIITAGSWSVEVLKYFNQKLLLQAGKGYSIEMDNPGIKYPAILCEANASVSPMGNKVRIGGTMELAGLDESISKQRVRAIKSAAEKFYPGISISEESIVQAKKGLRPVSPDGMPYIGKLNRFENVYLATGHAMMGMSLGPATGLLISQMIEGKVPFMDTSLFHPNRFD